MNRTLSTLVLSTTLALPLAALAQEATVEPATPAATKTRAEVHAELQRARSSGEMKVFRAGYVGEVKAPQSRAEVRAELDAARASGELDRIDAEAVAFTPVRAAAPATRYAVAR